jgi:hypothetical protein
MPWLKLLFTGLLTVESGFQPRLFHVGFVVNSGRDAQVFSKYLGAISKFYAPER